MLLGSRCIKKLCLELDSLGANVGSSPTLGSIMEVVLEFMFLSVV
jgi:hypothetical protein